MPGPGPAPEPGLRGLERAGAKAGQGSREMRAKLLIGILVGLLAAAAAVSWRTWSGLDGAVMTGHGYIALAAGVTLSLIVGGGLMALVFFSARKGYDNIDDPSQDDG